MSDPRIIRKLADEVARSRLQVGVIKDAREINNGRARIVRQKVTARTLKAEVLYVLIAKFVAAAMGHDEARKNAVTDAATHYGVTPRTVEAAIRWHKSVTEAK